MYKKYGPYDNSMDVVRCKALLEIYKENQAEHTSESKNAQINVVNRTYPLAYNAYNLDEKKVANATTASGSGDPAVASSAPGAEAASKNHQPAVTVASVTSDTEAKDKVLDELFEKK